jgi:hypothetical protein
VCLLAVVAGVNMPLVLALGTLAQRYRTSSIMISQAIWMG